MKFLIDSSHIDSVSKLFFLEFASLDVAVAIHLLMKLIVQQILHLPLPVYDLLRYLLVFFWAEVRLGGLLNVLLVYLLTHLVHLDLLVQDLPYSMLLLLSFHVTCHLETIVLLFKDFKLLFIFHFLLARAHQVHFESFTGVSEDAVGVIEIVLLWAGQNSLVLARIEGWFLNEPIVERLLLFVLELDLVCVGLVAEHERFCLQVKHVLVLFGLAQSVRLLVEFILIWCLLEPIDKLLLILVLFLGL